MSDLFLKLINMSITAGWAVLAVVILRLLTKKAPKWLHCSLWGIVGLRLLLPVSLESALSRIPSTQTIQYASPRPTVHSGLPALNRWANGALKSHYFEGVTVPTDHFPSVMEVLSAVWLAGVFCMLLYGLVSVLLLRRKVAAALPVADGVYCCDYLNSPLILGLFRPRIYLPSGMSETQVSLALAHEHAHLERKDHLWKPLGFLLLSFYWFNPILWLAYFLLCRDIERACDEKVLQALGPDQAVAYSSALISCSGGRRTILACPLAFGETDVKARVKEILNYQKPAFWLILLAIAVGLITAACYLTDPIENRFPVDGYRWEFSTAQDASTGAVSYCAESLLSRYPDAQPLSLSLYPRDGSFLLYESGRSYSIQYAPESIHRDETIYQLTTARGSGHAVISSTRSAQGRSTPTMLLSLGGYVLSFTGSATGPDSVTDEPVTFFFSGSSDWVLPSLTLDPASSSFRFCYSALSSTIPTGRYEWTENALVLHAQDGSRYTFITDENPGLIFDATRSSAIPQYRYSSASAETKSPVPHGAVFLPASVTDAGPTYLPPVVDAMTFDLDGDGTQEQCCLTYGPTSGVASFCLTAFDNGSQKYSFTFTSECFHLSFESNSDGTVSLRGKDQNGSIHRYSMQVHHGQMILSEN